MNLVVNSRDAMPTGGKLIIETANADLDETYCRSHPSVQPGRYVMIAVSDTGSGMDAKTQARIFEPFFTTKEQGKGTGLGLATVYGVVKQSEGYIWVYSELGKGTTFKIYFPRIDEPAPSRGDGSRQGQRSCEVPRRFCWWRMPSLCGQLTCALLKKNGYTVLAAENGKAAIELAERQDRPIHLLLTDVVMPGMSGRELANYLAAKRPDMRVLYMSGYTNDAIVHHGVLESGIFFIEKPFSQEALMRKLREVLDCAGKGSLCLTQFSAVWSAAFSLSFAETQAVHALWKEGTVPQHALVVDDDLEMCKLIQAILHSADTEALISTDSAHAVELLHNQKFDAVFLDVNMPPPDGIELTRLIRASGPNQKTPVIIVTGEEDPSVVSRGFQAGATFFLFKPINRERLLNLSRATHGAVEREKRHYQRVVVSRNVQILFDQDTLEGQTIDVSLNGLLVRAPRTLAVGSPVSIRLFLSSGSATDHGEWNSRPRGWPAYGNPS